MITVGRRIFAFRGNLVYELEQTVFSAVSILNIEPIENYFPGAPKTVDAALFIKVWNVVYLFKGTEFWKFDLPSILLGENTFRVQNGYPKLISLWNLALPFDEDIDTAFWYTPESRIYFVKGEMVTYVTLRQQFGSWWTWRPSPGTMSLVTTWPGLPRSGITAAQTYSNDRLYFYTDKGEYYRWNGLSRLNGPDVNSNNPYPRSAAVWWFECSEEETARIRIYPPPKADEWRFFRPGKK
jgi:hypothetical protein